MRGNRDNIGGLLRPFETGKPGRVAGVATPYRLVTKFINVCMRQQGKYKPLLPVALWLIKQDF